PAQIRHLVDRAMRIAQAERTPTCIIVPNDLQEEPYEDPPHAHGAVPSGIGWSPPRVTPANEDLRRAADVLNAGERVAMLIGAGALGAARDVPEVTDLLGAGWARALPVRAPFPGDLPWVTGVTGLLVTKPSWD